ncbi:nucleoside-diphosphate kinase [bacterium]|nr:nucleoside-diphosphate kinase [bacterium]
MIESTLLLIKPNAVKNKNIGEIISIIEKDGFLIKNIRYFRFTEDLINIFYKDHIGKSFFDNLNKFMLSDVTIALHLERDKAIERLRQINGDTDPETRETGTIRSLFADTITANAVHSSDSPQNAKRELEIIFGYR